MGEQPNETEAVQSTCKVSRCLSVVFVGLPRRDSPSKKLGASTHCTGVLPFLSGASMEAPLAMSSLMRSGLASYAAMWMGRMYWS